MLFEGILLILLCMVCGAFFSGMETGVISINRMRLRHRVREGSRRAIILESYLGDTDKLLGTTLVGTNLCLVMVSTMTASLSLRYGNETIRSIAAAVMGMVVLTFCEYLPKSWFHARPLDRCLRFAPLLRFFGRFLYPVGRLLTLATRWTVPGANSGPLRRGLFVSREHLRHIARDSEQWGHLTALERGLIDRVLRLQDRTAGKIMTPARDMITVDRTDNLGQFYDKIRKHGLIRMPVRDSTSGEFVGIINLFYLTGSKVEDQRTTRIEQYMRPPLFVPEAMPADDILPVLRRHRQPMALVRDQAGRVTGLVTTEDVLKQIAGTL